MKKSYGKKKLARTRRRKGRSLTRVELTAALSVGLTTIDRLIAFGLPSVGRRGRAHLYSLATARRHARKLAPAEEAAGDVLLADYRSQTEDLHDRTEQLESQWIADETWRPLWKKHVAAVARFMADWPAMLADRLAATSEGRWAIDILSADNPRPDHKQPPQLYPELLMRPLLQSWSDLIATHATTKQLARGVASPPAAMLPPAPNTLDEARMQWRDARARYRRARVRIRRGHQRRCDVAGLITAVIRNGRHTWWTWRSHSKGVAGNYAAAFASADKTRREILAGLARIDGSEPGPSTVGR